MTLLTLPKYLHPDHRAGVKPTGPVALDMSHPLARKLRLGILFRNNGAQIDLTGRHSLSWVDDNGVGQIFKGREVLYKTDTPNGYLEVEPRIDYLNTDPWSIAWRSQQEDLANGSMIAGDRSETDTNLWERPGSYLRLEAFSSSSYNETNIANFSQFASKVVTSSGGGVSSSDLRMYENGVGYLTSSTATLAYKIKQVLSSYNSEGYNYEGWLDYVYIFDSELTPAEAKSLHVDPYQLLKPAIPMHTFISTPILDVVTTTYPLELPKRLHPDFAIRGRQPTGAVAIDWSNPLTKGLLFFQSGDRNYVDGTRAKRIDATGAREIGDNARVIASNNSSDAGWVFEAPSVIGLGGSNEFTFGGKFSLPSNVIDRGVMSVPATRSSYIAPYASVYLYQQVSDLFTIGYNAAGTYQKREFTTPAFSNTTYRSIILTRKDGFSSIFEDGVLKETDTIISGDVGAVTVPAVCLFSIDENRNGAEGRSEWSAIWSRELTALEIKAISDDPYQILKPIVPMPMFISDVVTSTYPIELPKRAHPDFVPKKHPITSIEIDRSNKFGRHIVEAIIPRGGALVSFKPDPSPMRRIGTSTGYGVRAGKFYGLGSAVNYWERSGIIKAKNALTFMCRQKWNGSLTPNNGANSVMIADTNQSVWGTSGCHFNIKRNDAQTNVFVGTGTTAMSGISVDVSDGNWHDVAATMTQGDPGAIYVDSIEVSSYGSQPNMTFTESTTGRTRVGYYYDDQNAHTLDSDVGYVFILDKELSASEVRELHADPYQVFKPAVPAVAFAQVSASATLYLRPDADDTDGGWTRDTGSNIDLYSAIDEVTASDVDYIQSESSPTADKCKVSLSNPGGTVNTESAHRLKYRYKRSNTSQAIDLTARLVQGSGGFTMTELPKSLHPDFSELDRKPVGKVVLDMSNPLAQKLKLCCLFDGQRKIVDYTGNHQISLYPAAGIAEIHEGRQTLLCVTNMWSSISPGMDFSMNDPWTVAWRSQASTANDGRICGTASEESNNYLWERNAAYLSFSGNLTSAEHVTETNITDFESGMDHKAISSSGEGTSSSDIRMYQGKNAYLSGTGISTDWYLDTLFQGGINGTYAYRGWFDYFYVFNAELTQAEIDSLQRNPYQVFKPAAPMMVPTSTTAIIASWTHTSISDSYTDAIQTLTAPQIASITDYDDLFLELEANVP